MKSRAVDPAFRPSRAGKTLYAVGTVAGKGGCFDAYGRPQFLTEFPPTCMSTIKSIHTASDGRYKLLTALFAVSQVLL